MSDINDPKNQNKINHFITEHAPLISLHIKQLRNAGKIPSHIEDDDLHFAGVHGLMDALHKFEPDRGHKFSTYAGQRIRGMILDHAASQDVIPKHIRQQAKQFKTEKPASPDAAKPVEPDKPE